MELSERQHDGSTLREHLNAVAARGGALDPRLTGKPPAECSDLWSVFVTLSMTRRSGFSAQPLTMTDIDAWCRINRVSLTPWELGTLLAVDSASVSRAAEKHRGKP